MFEYARLRAARRVALALLGLVMTVLFLPSVAMATPCEDLVKSVLKMDAESVKPPGYFAMRRSLFTRGGAFCLDHRVPASEYWFDINGAPTGIRGDQPRPANAAYSTTPEIAAACARTNPGNPSTCAMEMRVANACLHPQDNDQRSLCVIVFGASGSPSGTTGFKGLPDQVVALDGRDYTVPAPCADILEQLVDNPGSAPSPNAATRMKADCPDFLAALERRIGTSTQQNATAFWAALDDLVISNFPPRGAPPVSAAGIAADPNFRRMCDQAAKFENQCRVNQGKMGAVGTTSTSTDLQAGDFNDCANVYGGVLKMCGRTTAAAATSPKVASVPAPKPTPPPPACPAGTKPTSDGYCISANQNYCGGGMMCGNGMDCLNGGRCFHANGCYPDQTKVGNKCFAAGKVYCSNGTYCEPGGSCNPAGGCTYPPGTEPSFTGPSCGGLPSPTGSLCGPGGRYYNPMTSKLCGTKVCNIHDECGNNECLSPYRQTQAVRQGSGQAR